jgi:hypothetical protein
MELQEGKGIEKFLIGQVRNPISQREWQRLAFEKGKGSAEHGIYSYREKFKKSLGLALGMDDIRKNQEVYVDEKGKRHEADPSEPHRAFANRLLLDIGDALEAEIGGEDSRYAPRFFTTVGSEIDYSVKVDCWVELFDKEAAKPVADFKIDLKTYPGELPGELADAVYYFDKKFIVQDENGHDKLDRAVYQDGNYKDLVSTASKSLLRQLKVVRPS